MEQVNCSAAVPFPCFAREELWPCLLWCFDHSLSLLCFVVETITETLQPSYRRASSYTRLHGEKINTRLTVVVDGTRVVAAAAVFFDELC
ncbi:hypothetical protein RP20_CCG005566 [Aedes albopictus]|nr:hypothetical protein RP20_CCG005566 [Aedes albopictus]